MLGIEGYPIGPLLADAYAMRGVVSFDDGLYVALARRLGEPLATTDGSLARAVAPLGVEVVPEP